ncbi:MAG: putative nucleotidyltransferase, partial [Phycisphaerales bacterium]|nr:putative nucleotidyltransferase [Phycisphaerales bacterium]
MPDPTAPTLPPILSAGTQVVSLVTVRGPDGRPAHPRGALGVINRSPIDATHAYRVRFPGGVEASLARADLAVLAHYQRPDGGRSGDGADPAAAAGSADPLAEHDLYRHVMLRVVVGSRAYGLHGDASDTDRRGVYLPPADRHWSLFGVPEQLENDATQEVYWELQKFLVMALKANPNVLEVLYTPLVEHATPLARELLDMRDAFLSKLVYQTYSGYMMSQFRKLQGDLRNKGEVKWKHVMHLIRLLLAGVTTLREGQVPVDA